MEIPLNFNQTKQETSSIYSVKWSHDSALLAVGKADGYVSIYDDTLSLRQTINPAVNESFPISSVKWRPLRGLTKNILLISSTDGSISHYHAQTGKQINQILLSPGDQALVCDYCPNGENFAVGCKEPRVLVYDENTKTLTNTLQQHAENLGHANRICSLNFFRENLILTGGWDNNLYIWDLRNGDVVRSFHGVNLEGDSVDVLADHLLCVDCSMHDQMKVWSLADGRVIFSNELDVGGRKFKGYTATFCKNPDSRRMFIGGSGRRQGYFFNRIGFQVVNVVDSLSCPIYCSDFADNGEVFVAGTKDGWINVMRYSGII